MLALFCKWLFWVAGAALLGFLLAWLMRGAKANEWQTQFEDRDASYKKLKGNHQSIVSKYEDLERSSNKLRTANSLLKKDLSVYETKTNKLKAQLKAAPTAVAATTPVVNKVVAADNSYEIRAWESKYAKLERELASQSRQLEKLKDTNESLHTRMEVLALTTEEAKEEKELALSKLHQYEEYRPRFEEANLERNTLKYKYEQLLAASTAVQTTQKETSDQTEVLTSEIAALKTAIAAANEQTAAQKNKIEELTNQNASALSEEKEIKTKYTSLLGLQERTEVKMKALKEQLAASTGAPADVLAAQQASAEEMETYKSRLHILMQENETLKGSLQEAIAANTQIPTNDFTAEIANWADKYKALSDENEKLKAALKSGE